MARKRLRGSMRALVMPLVAGFWLQAACVGRDTALENWSEFVGLIPGFLGNHLRRAFLGFTTAQCDPSASIGFGTLFSKSEVRIEAGVYIGARCQIALAHLERDAMLAPGVQVTSGPYTHGTEDGTRPIRDQPGALRCVRLGQGCWIGSAAVVMADVGAESVVGAGSVVSRPLPIGVVAVGVPARVIRVRRGLMNTAAPPPAVCGSGGGPVGRVDSSPHL